MIEFINTSLSSILSSDIFKLFLIISGGLWVYHKFSTDENKTGLTIQFESLKLLNKTNGKFYVDIKIGVKNVGNRQLSLELNDPSDKLKTSLKVYSINDEDSNNSRGKLTFIDEYIGRSSHLSINREMRIRPNVNNNFSYLVVLDKPGNYMFEFRLTSNLDKHRSNLSYIIAKTFRQPTKIFNKILKIFGSKKRIKNRDVRIVVWKENAFYAIKNDM